MLKNLSIKNPAELVGTLVVLACASVSPLIFVAASAGFYNMQLLALVLLLPAIVIWLAVAFLAYKLKWGRLRSGLTAGLWAGIAGTVGLEIVRITGFRVFDAMPGSMPELIGVLMTNRFMDGPDILSNLLGWSDHFLNGVGFATIFILIIGASRPWIAIPYALVIATIFMISPATTATGIGYFGVQYGIGFAITVYLAHIIFGTVFGRVAARLDRSGPIWSHYLQLGRDDRP